MYVCMYVCTYIYICLCTYIMHVCVCWHMYTCTQACSLCVYMYIQMCMYVCIHIYLCIHVHVCVYVCKHLDRRTCIYTTVSLYIYVYRKRYIDIDALACIFIYLVSQLITKLHTHTHARARTLCRTAKAQIEPEARSLEGLRLPAGVPLPDARQWREQLAAVRALGFLLRTQNVNHESKSQEELPALLTVLLVVLGLRLLPGYKRLQL